MNSISLYRCAAALARRATIGWLAIAVAAVLLAEPRVGTCASPVAPMVARLKSGKVPAERAGAIIAVIGNRGDADDLAFLLQQAVAGGDWNDALRLQALQGLADATVTRGIRPAGELISLERLIRANPKPAPGDEPRQLIAIRLAGLWHLAPLSELLVQLSLDEKAPLPVRQASVVALGQIGGAAARKTFDTLLAASQPAAIRSLGVAGLAQEDLETAAQRGADVLATESAADDPAPVVDLFLSHTKGGNLLAAAIRKAKPPTAVARRALEHLYAIGRIEGDLPTVLSEIAGIAADMHLPNPDEIRGLVAEVQAKGDAARGEAVFRRANLSCMKCHAVSGAGGNVGPDLSAVGGISPIEYLLTSVLIPELSVKEAFLQAVVETSEGNVYQGIVLEENNDLIVLRDVQGKIVKIPRDGEEVIKKGGSLMPKGLVNLMSHDDFLDLVRFLSELGKPGPLALRSTATLQRWRFLQPVPPSVQAADADTAAVRADVCQAPASAWQPAYAKVAGMLPLDEIVAAAGSPVVYLQAQANVTEPGRVDIRLNSAQGVSLWVDGQACDLNAGTLGELARGEHPLVFRVDTTHHAPAELRAELLRPEKSAAEFTAGGGP
jgi:putative heme-binding domain-containing protein